MDISKKNNIREKHWKKRVYFNEVDLIGVANSYKLSKSPDISIERTNSEKEEKRESRQNGPVALIRESYGQQDKLIERINIINERKQLFFGLMMFFISSTLFLGATFFYFSQSVDKENQLNNAEKLKLNDTKTRLEQIIEAKTVENNSLNVKLAVLQEKGNQK